MAAVTFDTLKFANCLKAAGIADDQAKAITNATPSVIGEVDMATKADLIALEQRIIIKLGSLIVVATGIILAVMRVAH